MSNATINAETARARVFDRLTAQEVETMRAEAAARVETERQSKEAEGRKKQATELADQIAKLESETTAVEARAIGRVSELTDDFAELVRLGSEVDRLSAERRALTGEIRSGSRASAIERSASRFHSGIKRTLQQKNMHQHTLFSWLDSHGVAFAH